MMQIGRDYGWREVARWAGILPIVDDDRSTDSQIEELEHLIAGNGLMLARGSYLDRPNAAGVMHARSLIARRQEKEVQKDNDARRGLAGMSMSRAINESFMAIMRPEMEQRLAVQRGVEMEEASASKSGPS